ncbi:MAG TPA: arsenate reductase ArsC [Bacteroidota bacterium]|nr:arsenate reductase ArsC [Bacteroidota bacterium]
MDKIKVLFLCIHNSARSQMAEAYLKHFGGERFEVESAGLEPGKLNPLVIEVLREDGIDISNNQTNDVFEFFKQGKRFHYVITVCDAGSSARCPIFPGMTKKIAWDFPDPSVFTGTHEEKLAKTRGVRNNIKAAVKRFLSEENV